MRFWLNGEESLVPSAANRAFAYGDGVFETVLLQQGVARLWPFHLQRLEAGLQSLSIVQPDLRWLDEVFMASKAYPEAVLKLVVYRGGGTNGYGCEQQSASVAAILKPFTRDRATALSLALSDYPVLSDIRLNGIKHLNRLQQVLAAAEAKQKGVNDLVMLDTAGNVCECISSNLFLRIDGQWCTPVLALAGVAGVMRRFLLEQFPEKHAFNCVVRDIAQTELANADAAFLTNSIRRVQPVASLAGRTMALEPSQTIMNLVNQELNA